MRPLHIDSLSDPRLEPYRNLKRTNLTRWSGRFIAEGRLVVERLLASRYAIESLLVSARRVHLLDELAPPPDCAAIVISDEAARELTGFNFHAGVMACGLRGEPATLAAIAESIEAAADPLLVACPRMTDPDNLGGLIRVCRAFGVTALLLGEACCDPFSRRTLRVSMGNAFDLPILESQDLRTDLLTLRERHGCQLTATVLAPDAVPLHATEPAARNILLLGNEAQGLEPTWLELCDRRLTIPMAVGADSLNVTVAAGICLHWLRHGGDRGKPITTNGPTA